MSKPGSGIRRLERSNVTGGGGGKRQKVSGRAHSPFGLSLPQIEKMIKNLDHEMVVVLDENGNFVFTARGDDKGVNFPRYMLGMKGLTVTHNHPKGEDFGGSLSRGDFSYFVKSNWHQLRAVVDDQGGGLYIVQRGANARPKAFERYLNFVNSRLKNKIDEMYYKTIDEELSKTGNLKKAMHIAGQKAFGITHAKMKKAAQRFGFVYVRRKRPFR